MELQDYHRLVDHYGREEYFRRIGERISEDEKTLIRSFSAASEAGDPLGRRLMETYCDQTRPERLYFAASIGDSWASLQLGSFHGHGHRVYHYDPSLAQMYLNQALAGNLPDVREEARRDLSVMASHDKDFELAWFNLEKYKGTDEVVVIPPRVRVIHYDAFRGNSHIRKVILHSQVRVILQGAFQDCVNLETVILPRGLQVIERDAFRGCVRLREINLPESLYILGYAAFRECKSLRSIRIPGGVHTLDSVFWDAGLEEVHLENGIRELQGFTFDGCPLRIFRQPSTLKKTSMFAIPPDSKERVQIYDPDAWNGENAVPSGQTKEALRTICRLEPQEKETLLRAVYGKSAALMEFGASLPDAWSILMLAWAHGAGQQGFPVNPQRAEQLCRQAAEISEGNRKTLAEKYARIYALTRQYPDKFCFREGSTLYVRPGETAIPDSAFQNDTAIETLWLPNTIRRIGKQAFRGCTGLSRIYWHPSVRQIDDGAFRGCTALKSLRMSEGLLDIGEYAFAGCSGLETAAIPGTVAWIGRGAFEKAGITTVYLGQGVRVIGKDAFRGCPLTTAIYPLSVETVEANALRDCRQLQVMLQYGDHDRLRMHWTEYKGRHTPFKDNSPLLFCLDAYDRNLRNQNGDEITTLLSLDGLPSRRQDSGYYVYIAPSPGPILI